jgi:hypothetical protein
MLADIATEELEASCATYWYAVGIFLADALSFCLALLEGVLVLELRSHDGGSKQTRVCSAWGSP